MDTQDSTDTSDTGNGSDADLGNDDSLGGLPFTGAATNDAADDGDDSESFSFGEEDDAQPDDEQDSTDGKELTPEEVMAKLMGSEKKSAKLAPDTLAAINQLGATWKGEAIQVKDEKELVDLVQKGFDYTRKSMERAEAEKVKEAEFAEREAKYKQTVEAFEKQKNEVGQQLAYFNLIDSAFREMEESDPDMADAFAKLLRQKQSAMNAYNPVIDTLKAETGQLKDALKQMASQRESEKLSGVRQGYEKEMSDVQAKYGAQLTQLGVKPNWEQVQKIWAADTDGKMTVEQALYSAHGKEITKAYESKHKVFQAKLKKSQAAGAKSSAIASGTGQRPSKKYATGDYDAILRG